jgi:WD40 repeat protein
MTLLCVFVLGAEARPILSDKRISAGGILQKNCVSCHNDSSKASGLSLQSYEALMKGGAHGAALAPGSSDRSRMVLMMEGIVEPRMPLGGSLSKEDILVMREWIDAGAAPWPASNEATQPNVPTIRPRVAVEPQIASLAFQADGKILAVGTYKEVRLLAPPHKEIKARLSDHADVVRALAFTADGSLLAAAGGAPASGGEIKIWDVRTWTMVRRLSGHTDCIYAASFSPEGGLLATGSYDRLIKLWDVRAGTEVRTLKGHVDAVFSLAISRDGKRLASASADRTVKIWDLGTGKLLFTLSEATEALYTVAFNPSGRFVAAAGVDKKIRLWKLSDEGAELVCSVFAHSNPILQLSFASGGNILASAGADRLVKLWEAETLQERKTLDPQPDWVLALAASPNGKLLAAGRYDGSVAFYEVSSNGR